jgi:hypothetical protein
VYLSEDYVSFTLAQHREQHLLRDLERRRVIAERMAEAPTADQGVTDVTSWRHGIRVLWNRLRRPVSHTDLATGGAA